MAAWRDYDVTRQGCLPILSRHVQVFAEHAGTMIPPAGIRLPGYSKQSGGLLPMGARAGLGTNQCASR